MPEMIGRNFTKRSLKECDPQVYSLIDRESKRQEYGLEMIPSENFASLAVMQAVGSVLTNKYAEGLPQKRYYGGCRYVDEVEELAIDRACKLFSADFVNVQPHSGAQANQAAFESILEPGDTVMGMRLDMGGHLTHGSPVNFSGKRYKVVAYGVGTEDHLIDPDEVLSLALEHSPKMIICGASAYSRKIDFKMFREVADRVGAVLMADIAHYAGLVAAGEYPTPFPYADIVTTTTHKTLRGPRGGLIFARSNLSKTINKNVFPGLQGGPLMHVIAGKAVALGEALTPDFKNYAKQIIVNARALSDALVEQGLAVVSGGTDSHLLVLDLRPSGVTGKDAQEWLDQVGITANKNTIPFDPQPPTICSGVRMGTPALTTRGMGVGEMKLTAELINRVLLTKGDSSKLSDIQGEVEELSKQFPLYADT